MTRTGCDRPAGILLAAGFSRRFGGDKTLLPLPGDGECMAVRAALHLMEAVDRTLVVLRPEQETLRSRLQDIGAAIIECPSAEHGMGESIANGVAHALDAAGWIIALADMPWIMPATIRSVANALADGAAMAAPAFQGRRGHPVGFSQIYRETLIGLSGDMGARSVLQSHAGRLRLIPCEDAGVLVDVDTPDEATPSLAVRA